MLEIGDELFRVRPLGVGEAAVEGTTITTADMGTFVVTERLRMTRSYRFSRAVRRLARRAKWHGVSLWFALADWVSARRRGKMSG